MTQRLTKWEDGNILYAGSLNNALAYAPSKLIDVGVADENAGSMSQFFYDKFINTGKVRSGVGIKQSVFQSHNGSSYIFCHGYDGSWTEVNLGVNGVNTSLGSFNATVSDTNHGHGYVETTIDFSDLGSTHVKFMFTARADDTGFADGRTCRSALYFGSGTTTNVSITSLVANNSNQTDAGSVDMYFTDGSYYYYDNQTLSDSGPVSGDFKLVLFGSSTLAQDIMNCNVTNLVYIQANGSEIEYQSQINENEEGDINVGLFSFGSDLNDSDLTSLNGSVAMSFDAGNTWGVGSQDEFISSTAGSQVIFKVTTLPPTSIIQGPGSDNFPTLTELGGFWG